MDLGASGPVLGNNATGFCSPTEKAISPYLSSLCVFTFLPKPEMPSHQLLQISAFPQPRCRDDSIQEILRLVWSCFLPGHVVVRQGFTWPISFWGLLCSSKLWTSFAWDCKPLAVFILEGCWKRHRPLMQHHTGNMVAHLCPCG